MNQVLLRLAKVAFDAIEKATGERLWPKSAAESQSVEAAAQAFDDALKEHDIAWLIDSAAGSGMSHLGWVWWMKAARSEEQTDA